MIGWCAYCGTPIKAVSGTCTAHDDLPALDETQEPFSPAALPTADPHPGSRRAPLKVTAAARGNQPEPHVPVHVGPPSPCTTGGPSEAALA